MSQIAQRNVAPRTPLADCTRSADQNANLAPTVVKRTHNPYGLNVLGSPEDVPAVSGYAAYCGAQSAMAYPGTPLGMHSNSYYSAFSHHAMSQSASMAPYRSEPASPVATAPSPQALRVVYRDGRPLPTLKETTTQAPTPQQWQQPASAPSTPVAPLAPAPTRSNQRAVRIERPLPKAESKPEPKRSEKVDRALPQPRSHKAQPQPQAQAQAAEKEKEVKKAPATPCTVVVKSRMASAAFNATDMGTAALHPGAYVIVSGDRGDDIGEVVEISPVPVTDADGELPKERVIRVASAQDVEKWTTKMVAEEDAAKRFVLQQIEKLQNGLDGLGLIHVKACTFQFDMKKLTVWYTSDERVYFVPLLKALHSHFKCRIWMHRLESPTPSETASVEETTSE